MLFSLRKYVKKVVKYYPCALHKGVILTYVPYIRGSLRNSGTIIGTLIIWGVMGPG
jgi:hypothetical protein